MITLVPYNPTWPAMFVKEQIFLQKALGYLAEDIQHIGSTAIPGICAKPVIDILIGVADINQFTQADISKITDLGYQYYPEFETTLPYRRFFRKNDSAGNATHQIHLVNHRSAWWQKHILFRNYLRQHSDAAKKYAAHKLELAELFDNTLDYAQAKTEFCQEIDKLAFYDATINKPFLTTVRLNAYIPQLACIDDYYSMLINQEFIDCYGVAYNHEQTCQRVTHDITHWDQYSFGAWMWYCPENFDYVGRAGLNSIEIANIHEIELAYAINPEYWGQNIAVEMGRATIDFAFNSLNLDNIVCFTLTTNHQSLRVMEKLGFVYEKDFDHRNLPHKLHRLKNLIP